ncbi:MAG: hypothetical protein JJU33_01200 [Phycisphaerales bacterium]|nr:hypothetical protein [Phycisphaerales bacterium]
MILRDRDTSAARDEEIGERLRDGRMCYRQSWCGDRPEFLSHTSSLIDRVKYSANAVPHGLRNGGTDSYGSRSAAGEARIGKGKAILIDDTYDVYAFSGHGPRGRIEIFDATHSTSAYVIRVMMATHLCRSANGFGITFGLTIQHHCPPRKL